MVNQRNIRDAGILRDDLLKSGRQRGDKEQRNKINSLKQKAKKKYFEELVCSKQNCRSVWSAGNQLTNRSVQKQSSIVKDIPPEDINLHFTTTADKSVTSKHSKENNFEKLRTYCNQKYRMQLK